MNIRTRTILIFLPVLITALLTSGIIGSFYARSGLMRVSMELLGFKAEELQGYVDNQWNLLVEYQLNDNTVFVDASKFAIEI